MDARERDRIVAAAREAADRLPPITPLAAVRIAAIIASAIRELDEREARRGMNSDLAFVTSAPGQ